MRLKLRTVWAVVHLAILGAVGAAGENYSLLPAEHQLLVVVIVGAIQAVLPSPVLRTRDRNDREC